MEDINKLFDGAINEIEYLNKNEEFFFKNLYKGYIWNRLSVSQKIKLSTLFLSYVENRKIVNVTKSRKVSRSQKYKKV